MEINRVFTIRDLETVIDFYTTNTYVIRGKVEIDQFGSIDKDDIPILRNLMEYCYNAPEIITDMPKYILSTGEKTLMVDDKSPAIQDIDKLFNKLLYT